MRIKIIKEGKMHYGASFWILPDNYDPFWVIIGVILFGLLFGYYIWIYYQFGRKHSESAPQKKPGYNHHKKVLEHT
jgi:hypothetical protein